MKFSFSHLIGFLFLFSSSLLLFGQTVQVGSGSYQTSLPAGAVGPQNASGTNVLPKISSTFHQPVQTNDFWSSLIFPYNSDPYSNTMYVHPLVVKAKADGLGIGYTTTPVITSSDYLFPYQQQLSVGVSGLNAPNATVDSYGDWTVTAAWTDGTRSMKATIGHGIPFVYFTMNGGGAKVTTTETPTIWANTNGVIGLTVGGRNYGLFAPVGSSWNTTNGLVSDLNGKNYFSVAVLPDNTPATLEFYRQHAYAFVVDSRVSWQYDQAAAKLKTTYTLQTVLQDSGNGNLNQALMGLYRHQWINTDAALTAYTYVSTNGVLKVFDGNEFSSTFAFNGILPALPDEGIYNKLVLNNYITQLANENLSTDATYPNGKAMARLAHVIPIADQMGNMAVRDSLLARLKRHLEAWLTAGGPEEFSYIKSWNTLIGYPSGYGADNQINDHNFHYGYFVMAAAIIAQYDSAWASEARWGGMINLLIRDCANWERSDTTFPYLRCFDPYAGHSWESGHGDFGDGNNEESSSESMNFSAAVTLWGANTGNKTIRDLGIFLYANERAAIEQYWFNVDNAVFPSGYPFKAVSMVWGGKEVHTTWFGTAPEYVHGINMLPITGGSLYLGRRPDYVLANYAEILKELNSPLTQWQDIIWQFLALADPQQALNLFNANPGYTPFDGETRAHTYHWIGNLKKMGRLSTDITADVPTFAVFISDSATKTYVAYNATGTATVVHYSDGFSMSVRPHALIVNDGTTGGNKPPVAMLLTDVTSGKMPLHVHFTGSQSYDPVGLVVSYTWDFGDSTSSHAADTVHVYQKIGQYLVTLTVANNLGLTAKSTVQITVLGNGTPYHGSPSPIPGRIHAADFDMGGEGVAYHDSDPQNKGVSFRQTEGVDIEGCSDGYYDVSWIVPGEWLEYTVAVQETAQYDISVYCASVPGTGAFHLEFDGVNVSGKKTVAGTGGWQYWVPTKVANVPLTAGIHIMRIVMEGTDFSISYLDLMKSATAVKDAGVKNLQFLLDQNYPNPFNPSTMIQFSLSKAGRVSLIVYDVLGNQVATLLNNEQKTAGLHQVQWNGAGLPSGFYVYRLTSSDGVMSRKMLLLK